MTVRWLEFIVQCTEPLGNGVYPEGVVSMEMAQCLVLYLDTLLSYLNAKETGEWLSHMLVT